VKVKNTVLHILSLFFKNNQNALISVYEEGDGRSACRKRLFRSWFNSIKEEFRLCIYEGVFEGEDTQSNCILVYTEYNQNIEGLHQCFQELMDNNFFISDY
jgi:hypothetical protein